MSIFTHVPDGFYEESRLPEQLLAVPRSDQFTIRDALVVTLILATTCGGIKAIVDYSNGTPNPVAQTKK